MMHHNLYMYVVSTSVVKALSKGSKANNIRGIGRPRQVVWPPLLLSLNNSTHFCVAHRMPTPCSKSSKVHMALLGIITYNTYVAMMHTVNKYYNAHKKNYHACYSACTSGVVEANTQKMLASSTAKSCVLLVAPYAADVCCE